MSKGVRKSRFFPGTEELKYIAVRTPEGEVVAGEGKAEEKGKKGKKKEGPRRARRT